MLFIYLSSCKNCQYILLMKVFPYITICDLASLVK